MTGPVNVSPAIVSGVAKLKAADPERIDQRDALRAVGEVHRLRQVVEEDPDDLAEAQRHDREIVAAQLQRRRAEEHAEEAGDGGADRQDDPEREMKVEVRRGEQRVDVGTDRVERDVAEIEQSGEPDDDVEPEGEQHEQDREVRDAHPRRADSREHERQQDERDADEDDADPRAARILLPVEELLHAQSPTRGR